MLTISLHPNDHTVLEKATQMAVSFARISLQEPHFFGNRNMILRYMRIINATVSKINQFIEPKGRLQCF